MKLHFSSPRKSPIVTNEKGVAWQTVNESGAWRVVFHGGFASAAEDSPIVLDGESLTFDAGDLTITVCEECGLAYPTDLGVCPFHDETKETQA